MMQKIDHEFADQLLTAPLSHLAEPLREHQGKQPEAFVSFGSDFSKVEFSENPRPLAGLLATVPKFSPVLLPESLRDYVHDVSERMQVPLDFVAVPLMVCLGAAIGRRLGLHPKQLDNWLVVPNLWGGIVAEPAQMKSPVFNEMMDFSYRLESEARTAHAVIDNYETEQAVYEAKNAALKERMKAAAKSGKTEGIQSAQQELAELQKPEQSNPARFVINDSTVEKIGDLLKNNPAGLLLYRDELTGFLSSMEKSGREGDRQFYLEAWSGAGRFNVDRIGRGSIQVDALCLSVLGGIQPGPLRTYTAQALKNGRDADGFIQRFQLLVWPDSPSTWRNVDRTPDYNARDVVWSVFESIASLPADDTVPAIRFDDDAQELFNQWLYQHENEELRSGDHPEYFKAHLAKYRSLMPSLALICHCAEHTEGYVLTDTKVNVSSAERAAAWCDYLKAHALRIYGETGPRPELEAAHALTQKIKLKQITDRMTVREIERAKWSKLTTHELVQDGLNILQDHSWLIVEKVESGGRPSELVRIHPDFH